MRIAPPSRAGFTLIELLVATAILAVATGVIGACVAAGIRVWDRARETAWFASSVLPGVELMERDLRNATSYSGTSFRGTPDSVAMGSLMLPPDGSPDGPRIGKVVYTYDARKAVLFRKAWLLPGREPGDEVSESVLENVRQAAFSYRTGAGGTEDEYAGTATNLPAAIRCELVLGNPRLKLKRDVVIPLGMK